jgi:hypothetical protein
LLAGERDETGVSVLWRTEANTESSNQTVGRLSRGDLIPERQSYWLAMLETLERWLRGEPIEPLILRE